jgi:hypothetical protein
MSKRFHIRHWIVARLRQQQTSHNSADNSELVTTNPEQAPSIVPYEDPDQLPGHGRSRHAF